MDNPEILATAHKTKKMSNIHPINNREVNLGTWEG